MGGGHDHVGAISHEKPLWWAFGLTLTFLVAEVVGGLWTNSLALLSDAAHMGTDVIALAISLVAVRLSRRPADAKRTYGYARMGATIPLRRQRLVTFLTRPSARPLRQRVSGEPLPDGRRSARPATSHA